MRFVSSSLSDTWCFLHDFQVTKVTIPFRYLSWGVLDSAQDLWHTQKIVSDHHPRILGEWLILRTFSQVSKDIQRAYPIIPSTTDPRLCDDWGSSRLPWPVGMVGDRDLQRKCPVLFEACSKRFETWDQHERLWVKTCRILSTVGTLKLIKLLACGWWCPFFMAIAFEWP